MGAVGQAIWDCGTLDIDCIKWVLTSICPPTRNVTTCRNCVDATSQCLGCICEVLDFWWPKDAPNCFKKEIIRVINKEESSVETGTQTGSQAGTSEAAAEDSDDTSKETVVIKTQEPTGPSQNTQYC